MKALDFFCGAGGFTHGLRQAGIDVLAGIDADGTCEKSFVQNNPGTQFIHSDIRTLTDLKINQIIGRCKRAELLFVGCAPCQPFSRQGRPNGATGQETLLAAFGRIVERFLPGQVVVENVPGLKGQKGRRRYQRFVSRLERLGYSLIDSILDAQDFGVPQTRLRLVLVATRGRKPRLPKATHGVDGTKLLTVRDAIAHLPPVKAGEIHSRIANHEASPLSELNLRRLKSTPPDGGDRHSWPRELVLPCHAGDYSGHGDVYGRLWWDRPAPTLTGKCNSLSNGRYGHPEQHRGLTLREAASLQCFEDDYEFFGYRSHIALHIGNAVPVTLAEQIGKELMAIRYGR